jgi:3-deoxy-7-phosphoheptulonate synthase
VFSILTISSWLSFFNVSQPNYPDQLHLERVVRKLSRLPALIGADEARDLKTRLAAVGRGEAFLLQGGDCAENLSATTEDVTATVRQLFKMAIVLMHGSGMPVVKIGRMAGQFAKVRS